MSICPLWLSLPRAVKSHMALFVSSFYVPATTGWGLLLSHLPLSAAQYTFQFKLKADFFSLVSAFPPPMASLVIYYLTQSPSFICTESYLDMALTSSQSASQGIVIPLQSWASALRGPISGHRSGSQTLKPN